MKFFQKVKQSIKNVILNTHRIDEYFICVISKDVCHVLLGVSILVFLLFGVQKN